MFRWALLAVSAVSPVAEWASVTLVLLMVRVFQVVPCMAESPAVPMVVVLPVALILRVLLPVVVGLVSATGGGEARGAVVRVASGAAGDGGAAGGVIV